MGLFKEFRLCQIILLFLALLFHYCDSYAIGRPFKIFLEQKYGKDIARSIYRPEVNRGCLGGNNHTARTATRKIPVIFVHGLGTKAGDYVSIQRVFKDAGYGLNELYALTWGVPGALFSTVHLECKHVLQIRRFLESVGEFTNSKVDIIGYSMGAALCRKAILGGPCVDNSTINLGPPLSDLVQTFLSVGGANHGSHLCISAASTMCNLKTGMHCNSAFILDINNSSRYEGSEVFAIFNRNDEWIGNTSPCGVAPYTLEGAAYIEYPVPYHAAVLWKSAAQQLEVISRKYAMGGLLNNIRQLRMRPIPSFITGNDVRDDLELHPRSSQREVPSKRKASNVTTALTRSNRLVALQMEVLTAMQERQVG